MVEARVCQRIILSLSTVSPCFHSHCVAALGQDKFDIVSKLVRGRLGSFEGDDLLAEDSCLREQLEDKVGSAGLATCRLVIELLSLELHSRPTSVDQSPEATLR